jgi:hypothetical protein
MAKSEKFGDYRNPQPDDAYARLNNGKDPNEGHFAGIMRKVAGERTDTFKPDAKRKRLPDSAVTPKGDKN